MVFDVDQAAVLLNVHKSYVYVLIQSGALACVKLGKRRLVRREAITELLTANAA